ncbi:hypothetical protein KL946_003223 [Ogataea haglerorum]|uniref:Transcription factor domain-containing protein n=1 Tax=Ogataea haglerorum TaxID=1937702 RepID=A0ABQ7RFA5_9ASCO|nr:hypothetical protein KL946_003223 [Ogataea haglerorum]
MASTLNIVQPKQSPKSDSPAPEHERLLPEVLLDQREPPGVPDKEALFVLFEKYRASQNVYGILNLQLFTECCDLYLSQRPPPAHAELVIRMMLSIAYTALHQSSRQALFSSLSTQSFDRAIQLYKQVLTTDTYNDWMLISTLMLLEHSLVNPGNPIVWYLVGIAVGFCARERYYSAELPLTNLQKRLFWTTYAFDRVVNHTLGRVPQLRLQDAHHAEQGHQHDVPPDRAVLGGPGLGSHAGAGAVEAERVAPAAGPAVPELDPVRLPHVQGEHFPAVSRGAAAVAGDAREVCAQHVVLAQGVRGHDPEPHRRQHVDLDALAVCLVHHVLLLRAHAAAAAAAALESRHGPRLEPHVLHFHGDVRALGQRRGLSGHHPAVCRGDDGARARRRRAVLAQQRLRSQRRRPPVHIAGQPQL